MKPITIPNVWNRAFPDQVEMYHRLESACRFRMHALNPDTWKKDRKALYQTIAESMNLHYQPASKLPLDYKEHGKPVKMKGYSVHKISYLGAPGRRVSGNLYVPEGKGPFPAVMNLHGHWAQGRLAQRVQERAHVLALNGFVVLAVDAFGAGERADELGAYKYHGALRGTALLNAGFPLMGILVTDNMRGVDLLQSLPNVIKDKIGATGGSGGGNQTMWLAAMDDRIKAAVPVVSVGTYEAYMRTENCVCELLPWCFSYSEMSAVISLVAPRAIMCCNGMHDESPSFQPAEVLRTVTESKKIFDMYGVPNNVSCKIFDGPHGYWQIIRESMVGFMLYHLKGVGNGDAVPEKPHEVLEEEDVMLFKDEKRPDDFGTIPDYCRGVAMELEEKLFLQKSISISEKTEELEAILRMPEPLGCIVGNGGMEDGWHRLTFRGATTGMVVPVLVREPKKKNAPLLVMSSGRGKKALEKSPTLADAMKKGYGIILFDVIDTGESATPSPIHPTLPDHHYSSRHMIMLGETMMGHWVGNYLNVTEAVCDYFDWKYYADSAELDVKLNGKTKIDQKLDQAAPQIIFAGADCAGIAALFAAVIGQDMINVSVITENSLCSLNLFETTAPEKGLLTLSVAIPNILRWGDLTLAAAMVQGSVTMISPRHSDDSPLSDDEKTFFQDCIDGLKEKLDD